MISKISPEMERTMAEIDKINESISDRYWTINDLTAEIVRLELQLEPLEKEIRDATGCDCLVLGLTCKGHSKC